MDCRREEVKRLLTGRLFWILFAGALAVNFWLIASYGENMPLVAAAAALKESGVHHVTAENTEEIIAAFAGKEPANRQISVRRAVEAVPLITGQLGAADFAEIFEGSWRMEAGLAEEIVSQYGTVLLPEEFEQLKGQKPVYEAGKTDIFIEQNLEYAALHVHSLKELMNLMGGRVLSLEEENRLWFQLYEGVSSEVVAADMERLILFDIWDYYIESYEQAVRGESRYENLTPQALKRVEERNKKEVYSPIPGNVTGYNFELLRYFAVFMMVSTTFFVMPYIVSENRSRMPALQYSFRKGRYYYENRMGQSSLRFCSSRQWNVLCIYIVPE